MKSPANLACQLHNMDHAASYPVWLQVQKMLRQIYRRSVEVLNLLQPDFLFSFLESSMSAINSACSANSRTPLEPRIGSHSARPFLTVSILGPLACQLGPTLGRNQSTAPTDSNALLFVAVYHRVPGHWFCLSKRSAMASQGRGQYCHFRCVWGWGLP